MANRLFRSLRRLAESWWQNDRIRAPPSEGRYFRIQPGDVLRVGEIQADVLRRSIIESKTGSMLCLNCDTSTTSAELRIVISADGKTTTLLWRHEDVRRELSSIDVEVWARNRPV